MWRCVREVAFLGLLGLAVASAVRGAERAGGCADENVIVHGTSDSRGRIIAEFAEQFRTDACVMLLGLESPGRWSQRCAIHVHPSPASFAEAVGAMPADSRGATSLEFSGDRVVSRRIDVLGDGPEIVPDALAHELVHVILADHFVQAAPPRWADEGLALLFDSAGKQAGHEADFRAAQRQGLAFTAADLFGLEHYPEGTPRQKAFYGQSAALVRWLLTRRDMATFIRFVGDLQSTAVDAALARHYGIDSVALLDSAWKEEPPIHTLSLNAEK